MGRAESGNTTWARVVIYYEDPYYYRASCITITQRWASKAAIPASAIAEYF